MKNSSINVVDDMKNLISYIVEITDPVSTNFIFSNMNLNQKSDILYLSEVFCNDQGTFYDSKMTCDCDIAYFGSHCQDPGRKFWGGGWTALQVIMSLFFVIFSITTWKNFRKNWKGEYGSFCKKLKRLTRTPKYLVIINVLIVCITRSVYVAVDPYRQLLLFNRTADRILHELVFSAAISIFYILLIVWIGLYSAFNSEINYRPKAGVTSKKKLDKENHMRIFDIIKEIIIILIFFIYPLQITFSYFRGSRTANKEILNIVLYIVLGIIVFFILVFCYFTCRLKITLSKSYEIPTTNQKGEIYYDDEDSELSKVDINDEIIFYNKIKEKSVLNIIVRNLINSSNEMNDHPKSSNKKKKVLENIIEENDESDEDSDLELEYENEMININLDIFDSKENTEEKENKQHKNNQKIDIRTINAKKRLGVVDPKMIRKCVRNIDQKGLILTKSDIKILDKIFRISYFIIIVAVFLTIVGILIEQQVIVTSPPGTIAFISFAFVFEIVTILAIFFLFIYDNKSDEYNNLKVIGDIENYFKSNRNKNSKLKFDEIKDTKVFDRFKTFINMEQ